MKKIVLFSALLLTVGCAHEMPTGIAFKTPKQLKLNSAAHWNVLAHNEASMVSATLEPFANLPVYVQKPQISTPFIDAYQHLLISNLAERGVSVVTHGNADTAKINYSVDIVQHPSRRYKEHLVFSKPLAEGVYYLAGSYLAKGVYDVGEVALDIAKAPFYTLGNQLNPDYASLAEVVITTRITMGKQVLNSESNVYYVDSANLFHYYAPDITPPPHHFSVTNQG